MVKLNEVGIECEVLSLLNGMKVKNLTRPGVYKYQVFF